MLFRVVYFIFYIVLSQIYGPFSDKLLSDQQVQYMERGVSGFRGMMVLNSHNYTDWKIKMEDLLIIKDLYEPINKEQIPTWVLESEWKLLNRKVVAVEYECIMAVFTLSLWTT